MNNRFFKQIINGNIIFKQSFVVKSQTTCIGEYSYHHAACQRSHKNPNMKTMGHFHCLFPSKITICFQ